MAGSAPKRKGDGYERELAKYLNEKMFNGDDKVQRMPLSGGGAVKSSGGSDLKNTPYIFVEAKRTEKFKIHESITRRNRESTGESLCVLRLDDFLKFYKAMLDSRSDN